MRTMNTEKLIKTLPTIQNQLDALLDFQVKEKENIPSLASFISPSFCAPPLAQLQRADQRGDQHSLHAAV